MKIVNIFKCDNCKTEFEVTPETSSGQVCPKCGSMSIRFLKREKKYGQR
jgi:DNA-directed RNA polymerase subunit RPC12/RpoP